MTNSSDRETRLNSLRLKLGRDLNRDLMTLYGEFEMYESITNEFQMYDLDMEFDTVMSNLFTASKMPREWREIRTAMEEQ
jgi:hypothetical protein